MRIYEGDYAYEIERAVNPETQLTSGWRYNVYRIRPVDELLHSGMAATREEAEKTGSEALAEVIQTEEQARNDRKNRAA